MRATTYRGPGELCLDGEAVSSEWRDRRLEAVDGLSGMRRRGLGEDAWTRVKRRLRAELGEDVFMSWLARLENWLMALSTGRAIASGTSACRK